jgi:hypothetical protein
MRRNRLEALQRQGLVVEGQYPEFRDIAWIQDGERHSMEIRPLVSKKADITVLRPTGTEMAVGFEYKL